MRKETTADVLHGELAGIYEKAARAGITLHSARFVHGEDGTLKRVLVSYTDTREQVVENDTNTENHG